MIGSTVNPDNRNIVSSKVEPCRAGEPGEEQIQRVPGGGNKPKVAIERGLTTERQ